MQLLDVNVLVYAYRRDSSDHNAYRHFLQELVNGGRPFAMSELVLSGFLRIVTHPKIFATPDPIGDALQFVNVLRDAPQCILLSPGNRHWDIFASLCQSAGARGNLIPDAYHAALAIEQGCEWITTDRDFARFPHLRWRHPLAPAE